MIGLALVLMVLSIGDLAAGGLTGEPRRWRDVLRGFLASLVTLAAATSLIDLPWTHWLLLATLALAGSTLWLLSKLKAGQAENRGDLPAAQRNSLWSLLALAATVILATASGGFWQATAPLIDEWLASLPFPLALHLNGGSLLLTLGIVLALGAPANGSIRALLNLATSNWKSSEQRLRGGRILGLLERWLIFGLALLGEPTAAALVISAKSILRFPELSYSARGIVGTSGGAEGEARTVDTMTEYFLIGSLSSWTLALAASLPLLSP